MEYLPLTDAILEMIKTIEENDELPNIVSLHAALIGDNLPELTMSELHGKLTSLAMHEQLIHVSLTGVISSN